jgi:phosphoribosylanthranilate isomerase
MGVDALGFDFRPGEPRSIEAAAVRRIVERLPVLVHKVGVFSDAPLIRILETVREAGLTAVQFHGDELPQTCAALGQVPWLKALRAGAGFRPEILSDYACNTFLLDGAAPGGPGGTGATFEWRKARGLSVYGHIIIGGGLDATNVGLAIEDARPWGVDVTAGIEFAPGKKDLDRMELFVEAVRRAERRLEEGRA